MGLLPGNGQIVAGDIIFHGQNLLQLDAPTMRTIRGGQIAMVFQESVTALNPVLSIGSQIAEVIRLHRHATRRQARQEAADLLRLVGLPEPLRMLRAYSHQLSGGMRQRVMFAMAIAGQPSLLIADEPVAALDGPLQAQILELLDNLKTELNLTVLLITHNLALAGGTCDRIVVMYAGKVAEVGQAQLLLSQPRHPYTQGLLRSMPQLTAERLEVISGTVPNLVDPPTGCRFHPRCPQALQICRERVPPLVKTSLDHTLACWLADT